MNSSLDVARLQTVQLVPLTAYDQHDRLALGPMQQLLERVVRAGIRVVIPCAGSAEFHALEPQEITAAVRMARDVMGPKGIVLAPIGFRWQQAVELADAAGQAGADGVLVMPLGFPYLSDAGAADYYRQILDRIHCPAVIYKKDPLPSDALLLELASHTRVIGVKYAMNDLDAFQRVVRQDRHGIEWFCGSAERFAPYFALAGATGYTSGAGNLCPRVTLAMHRALAEGNWSEAMRWQQVILPIEEFRARQGSSYNISFLKHAATLTGLDFGPPRPPYRRLTASERDEIERVMSPILQIEYELAERTATAEV